MVNIETMRPAKASEKSRGGGVTAHIWPNVQSLTTFICVILFWEFGVRFSGVATYIIPPASAVAVQIYEDAVSGIVFAHFLVTFMEVGFGFAGAALYALVLGSCIALIPAVEKIVYPYIIVLQTIPKIAIAPLFLIWFGYGIQTKAITAGLIAFFPILINVIAGLKATDSRRILLMKSMKAAPMQTFLKLRLLNALPYLFAGLETAIIFAVLGAVVGEFIGGSLGIGSLIIQRQATMNVAGVFSAIFYLSLMGYSLSALLRLARRKYVFW